MDTETLYPVGSVAREAGFSPEWIRRLCDRGDLACVRDAAGRRLIPEGALRQFVGRTFEERRLRGRKSAGRGAGG